MGSTDRVAFLIAGVQKGGTTALFDYLAEHPWLSLPACKEAHFFDDETNVDWSAPDYTPYHALFENSRPGAILGEATPIYVYWPNSLERIADYNPAMGLILLFRDPVERAWSHWRMETARGAETRDFSWCIREGRRRVTQSVTPVGAHRVHSYVERGFYGAQMTRVLHLFPRHQILCLRSDTLRDAPDHILRQVCDFLHAPYFTDVTKRLSHVGNDAPGGQSLKDDDRTYLRSVYAEDQEVFRKATGISFEIK
ncbi:sulfotransferase domain-containing protein [Brevundimonas sp. SL161]|uniref:sulfotransferase domain-containing protein n=1 Tax=Brevundimonas sp. SL161 TaxID=2804613 RepID=UPI003CF5EF34